MEKDASYESAEDLRDAVLASGGDCPGETVDGQEGDGELLIRCSDTLTLRLFANEEELKVGKLGFAIGFMDDDSILAGPNWIVQGPTGELDDIQETLGGELSVK